MADTIEEMHAKHEERQNLAQGYLEEKIATNSANKEKMQWIVHERAMDKLEEEELDVESMLQRGVISNEEARRIRARQRMHKKFARGEHGEAEPSKTALAASGFATTDQMLEDILRGKKVHWLVACVWKTFRLHKVENFISAERRRRAHPSFKHAFPGIYTAKSSPRFEALMFTVVIFNALLIGFQISDEKGESSILRWCERLIMGTFLIEIVMRVLADGWLWFLDWANSLDFVLVVGTGLLPTFVFKPFFEMEDTPVLRIGQALRCLRVVRLLKRLRAKFRTLWMLISGIVESALTLMWTAVIFIVVLYMFSILIITFLVKSDVHYDTDLQAVVDAHFNNVFGVMFTLFQFLTLDSWTGVCRPLHQSYFFPIPTFLFYVAVAVMVLNNLVVAVIVNNAFARSANDEELQANIKSQDVQLETEGLYELFELLDEDGSQRLTQQEYELGLQKYDEPWVKLRAMQVDDPEIQNLWEFLSFPEEIGSEMWASNLRGLKGVVKAKDTFAISISLQKQHRRISQAARQLAMHKQFSHQLLLQTIEIQREMLQAAIHLQEFVKYVHPCLPPAQVPIQEKDVMKVTDAFSRKVAELIDYPDYPVPEAIDDLRNDVEAPIQAFLTPAEAVAETKKKQKAIQSRNRQSNAVGETSFRQDDPSARKKGRVAVYGLFADEEPLQLEDVQDSDFETSGRR
eukprot:TRINITY_DN14830_c0_g1_i1.p1 TRINITY_DN14830_c0_g1~~TRINITY_DN14830_c0_g1_i1.p1  ORF type:complete len:688 (+),score=154.00 TRINITY_DN14830_c0_g1_i1:154-2217(+)